MKWFPLFLFLLISGMIANSVKAQVGSPLGAVQDESKQGIDLYTGRVNFTMPIIQASGRGSAPTSLNVSISQPQWQVYEAQRYYNETGSQVTSIRYAVSPSLLGPSGTYLAPPRIEISSKETFGLFGSLTSMAVGIAFTDSDGRRVELRDDIRDGEPSIFTGDFEEPPPNNNCRVILYDSQGQPLPVEQILPPNQLCNRGKVFRAKDGSSMTFLADNDIYDANYINYYPYASHPGIGQFSKPAGTVYMPNGTKYRFGEIPSQINTINPTGLLWMEDKDGNRTTFTYWENPNCNPLNNCFDPNIGKLKRIVDSIGREINLTFGDTSQDSYFNTVSYKGFGGNDKQVKIYHDKLQNSLRPDQTLQTYYQLFPSIGTVFFNNLSEPQIVQLNKFEKKEVSESLNQDYFNPTVITRISFSDDHQYSFQYNSYGEVARVISPLNSYTDYNYGHINHNSADSYGVIFTTSYIGTNQPSIPIQIYRRGIESNVYAQSGILQNKTTYSGAGGIEPVILKVFDTATIPKSVTKHHFLTGNVRPLIGAFSYFNLPYDSWKTNKEFKKEILDPDNLAIVLKGTEMKWEQRVPVSWYIGNYTYSYEPENDPRVTEVKSTLETGQVARKTINYDQYNNITDIYEYDYINGSTELLLTRNHTDYVVDSNYTSHTGAHLRRLPLQSWVSSDSTGSNKALLTQYEYDNYSVNPLVSRNNVVGHNSVDYGTTNIKRGNVTKIISYSDAQNSSGAISAQTQYDILGNVVKTIDAKGYFSTIEYSDRFGTPNGEARGNWDTISSPTQLSGQNTFAYATSTTNPAGFTTYSQFEYFTGVNVDSEDINGNISTTFYNDVRNRPTQIIKANNRPDLRSQITTIYDDVNKKIMTTSDLYSFGDNLSKAEKRYNSLGQTTETRSYETGGYIVTENLYDGLGRVVQSSTPYRPYQNEQPNWTTTTFDKLGRVTKVKSSDNAEVNTTYNGNITTVVDAANKKRRTVTNAIEQLIRVDEPNNNNDLGSVSNPNQATYYTYDTLGNLAKISQGQQNRYFLYDSLGKLIRVRQPEQDINSSLSKSDPITNNNQWSTGTTYDANGNPLTLTDARGVVITNTYDNLNRPLTKTYSDGTPTITYDYENGSIPFSTGQLTKVSSSISSTEYTAFNALGMVLNHKQITDGQVYDTAYSYNLVGGLKEQAYPNGRIVKNSFDNDGRLKDVTTKAGGQSSFHISADNFSYTSVGMIASMRFGNGRWESAQFNSRSQIKQIGLGTSQGLTNLWQVNYDYGEINSSNILEENKNNGNIARQTINFAGLSQPFVQTYKYDSLNRLNESKEMNGTTQTWIQSVDYDRYGNRTTFNQQKIGELSINQTPTVDPYKNRFTTGQGFTYDFNGNLITDSEGRQFTFNGDNKQVEVKDASNNPVGQYYYDGNGNRVKKMSAMETTIFVYDAGNKLIAEYSTQQSPNPTVSYLTHDSLNSPRVITDNSGSIISRRDFMPFGEELYAGTANRAEISKYSVVGTDTVRKRFTGYEKDVETGLDFAQARMYDNSYGRFTAVDPLLASGQSANPQTFNRYVYVANNPVVLTDPTGMFIEAWSHGGLLYGVGIPAMDPFMSVDYIANTQTSTQGEQQNQQQTSSSSEYYVPAPPIDDFMAGSLEYQEYQQTWERGTMRSPENFNYTIIWGYPDGTFFSSAEDAAIYQLQRSNSRSIELNREIPFAVVQDPSEFISVIEGLLGTYRSSIIPNVPSRQKFLAEGHTHARYDPGFDSEIFSDADKIGANSRLAAERIVRDNYNYKYSYAATPSGRIIRFEAQMTILPKGPTVTLRQRTH